MPGSEGAPIYPFAAPDGSPTVYNEYGVVAAADAYRLEKLQRSVPMEPLPQPDPQPVPLSLDGYAWLDSADTAQPPALAAGQSTRLMLAWRRTGTLDRRYVVFIHVLDPVRQQADGAPAIVTQSDHEPGGGLYPTTFWESWTYPGVVLDQQQIEIPPDSPPGMYAVWAGAYDKETGERIELGGPGETLVHVGDLEITP